MSAQPIELKQPTFVDRAAPLLALDLWLIRLKQVSKEPIDPQWQNLATRDMETILRWDRETPSANVGIVAKSDFCFFESDQSGVVKKFEEETGKKFETLTSQSRPGHYHFIFYATDFSRSVGSITQKELGFGSLRQGNAYIVGAGSVHPATGELYKFVRNAPIVPVPDDFIKWLVSKKTTPKPDQGAAPNQEFYVEKGGRNVELTRYAGVLRKAGLDGDLLEEALWRYNLEHCKPPLDQKEVKTIAHSVAHYPKGSAGPSVTIAGKPPGMSDVLSQEEVKTLDQLQALADSTPDVTPDVSEEADSLYPCWVWQRTLYQEFADFCGCNNLIPKELFIEAMKTVVGAICGHRFDPQEGRFYTVLLTKVGGIGKGTAICAATDLFIGTGLLWAIRDSSVFMNVGCASGSFGSSPGMFDQGFAKQNRILQCYDEMTKLLEKFSIPNSGDAFLDDLNTLFEANAYEPSLTKGTKIGAAVAGSKHNSILGGTTFDKWNSAFGKTTAEGSGFFQRLNVISSEETETVPEIPRFDFSKGKGLEIKNKFVLKIQPLEFQKIVFEKTTEATKLFHDWHAEFKKKHAEEPAEAIGRLNVMVTRNYEHLAFMLSPIEKPAPEKASEPIQIVCDLATMEKAIALSEYQLQARSKHRPAQGANDLALIEDSIRLTLLAAPGRRMARSNLYKKTGSRKYGLGRFGSVLEAMQKEGIIAIFTKSNDSSKGRKGQIIIWLGEGSDKQPTN